MSTIVKDWAGIELGLPDCQQKASIHARQVTIWFRDLSSSVLHTIAKAEDFMPILPNVNDLDLGETNPTHFCDIIKSLQT